MRKIIPYDPRLKLLARKLRNDSTKSEVKLWMALRNKQMMGYDFHRQRPVDRYILDFFCYELMLGIEVDGLTHTFDDVVQKDAIKEARMNELGIHVLRFSDEEVLGNIDGVWEEIREFAEKARGGQTHPNPSQEGTQ